MNEEELEKLKDFLEKATSFELPSYDHLPAVPLYMEQVVSYVNSILEPLSVGDKEMLTSYMVNNYVKAKIIQEPDKKKYNVDHLGYLLAISLLKNVINMNDIGLIIGMDKDATSDKAVLYRFFRTMSSDIFKDVAGKAKTRVDRFYNNYESEKENNPEQAKKYLDDSIGLIALRMSVQATVYQLVAQALYRYLENAKKEETPSKKEVRREKKEAKRAQRLASEQAKKDKESHDKKEKK